MNKLLRYKTKRGNCNVPQSQGKLGTWVRNQRRDYAAGSLAQDRIDRLNSIGFDWTPPLGRPRKRKSLPRLVQNQSSSRKKWASLRSATVSLSVGARAECMCEGRDVTSVSLSIPSNGSFHTHGTESDDEDVDEIGALIYDQVVQRRQATPKPSRNCVYRTMQDTTSRQRGRNEFREVGRRACQDGISDQIFLRDR